jgi:regulator of sirC expression with transglutaminase-like and TPR domain
MGRLREEFAAFLAAGDRADLARGALLIARIGHPGLDPAPSLAALDGLAADARGRVAPGTPTVEAVAAVAAHLFHECGFHGNEDDYYDPRNSFLNDVLERRTGIPITLAVVLLETGRRLGLQLSGVGFPGHFLVAVDGERERILLDPFFGGRPVEPAALLERYRAASGAVVDAVPPEALATADVPAILVRMLRNLLHVYLDRRDPAHALSAVDLLLVLAPDAPAELRVRGLLYETLECFTPAFADLRRYLELAPEAADADDIRARVARLARAAETIH